MAIHWPAALERIKHSRLLQSFILIAFTHAIVQSVLQGKLLDVTSATLVKMAQVEDGVGTQEGALLNGKTSVISLGPSATQAAATASASLATDPNAPSKPTTLATTAIPTTAAILDAAQDDNDDDDERSTITRTTKSRAFARKLRREASSQSLAGRAHERTQAEAANLREKVSRAEECVAALLPWAKNLRHMRVTSTAFIFYEVWMFLLALAVVLLESVPHLCAVALAHALAAAFSIHQRASLLDLRDEVALLAPPVCPSTQGLLSLAKELVRVEQALVALDFFGSFALAAVGWQLPSVLSFQQFTTIGADPITRLRRHLILGVEISLQLSLFFLVAFQAIWLREIVVDKLNVASDSASGGAGVPYEVMIGVITAWVPVWVVGGAVAVRRERVWMLAIFLVASAGFAAHGVWLETRPLYVRSTAGWGFMRFLGAVGIAGAVSTIPLGLALLYSWLRVGKKGRSEVEWTMSFAVSRSLKVRSHPPEPPTTGTESDSQENLSAAFGYHSHSGTATESTQRLTGVSTIPSESSMSLSDSRATARSFGPRPKKAPPPALVLTQAVAMQRHKLKVVPVNAEIDGSSIRAVDLADELEEVGSAPVTRSRSASRRGMAVRPAQWPAAFSIERTNPLSAVPEIQSVEEDPVIATWVTKKVRGAPAKLSVDATLATGRRSEPHDGKENIRSPSFYRGRHTLQSRWSESTRGGSERAGSDSLR